MREGPSKPMAPPTVVGGSQGTSYTAGGGPTSP